MRHESDLAGNLLGMVIMLENILYVLYGDNLICLFVERLVHLTEAALTLLLNQLISIRQILPIARHPILLLAEHVELT